MNKMTIQFILKVIDGISYNSIYHANRISKVVPINLEIIHKAVSIIYIYLISTMNNRINIVDLWSNKLTLVENHVGLLKILFNNNKNI